MRIMLFWLGLGIVAGYIWGRYSTSKAFSIIFKIFQDEMHAQYLQLLERNKIAVKPQIKRRHQEISRSNSEQIQ